MTLTTDTQTQQSTTTVTVRIPDDTDMDLTTATAERLERPAAVQNASVTELEDISPVLSAITVTARVTVTVATGTDTAVLASEPFVTVVGDG